MFIEEVHIFFSDLKSVTSKIRSKSKFLKPRLCLSKAAGVPWLLFLFTKTFIVSAIFSLCCNRCELLLWAWLCRWGNCRSRRLKHPARGWQSELKHDFMNSTPLHPLFWHSPGFSWNTCLTAGPEGVGQALAFWTVTIATAPWELGWGPAKITLPEEYEQKYMHIPEQTSPSLSFLNQPLHMLILGVLGRHLLKIARPQPYSLQRSGGN